MTPLSISPLHVSPRSHAINVAASPRMKAPNSNISPLVLLAAALILISTVVLTAVVFVATVRVSTNNENNGATINAAAYLYRLDVHQQPSDIQHVSVNTSSSLLVSYRDGGHVDRGAVVNISRTTAVAMTIVSLLRDMSPQQQRTDPISYDIQLKAILSWRNAVSSADRLILFMDSSVGCEHIATIRPLKGVQCLAVPCWHSAYRKPTLDCIFSMANALSRTDIVAYVNGDIIAHKSLATHVEYAHRVFGDDFLLVARRTDVAITTKEVDVLAQAHSNGRLHDHFGIDLFVYHRKHFPQTFPPFLAGVYRWDNFLLAHFILRGDIAVVDVTQHGLIVHQELTSLNHNKRRGAEYNDALVKSVSGRDYLLGHVDNADYQLKCHHHTANDSFDDAYDCELIENRSVSMALIIRRRLSAEQTVVVVGIESAADSAVFTNFVCWQGRHSFNEWIAVTADETLAAHHRRSNRSPLPIITPMTFANNQWTNNVGDDVSQWNFQQIRTKLLSAVVRTGVTAIYVSAAALWLNSPKDTIVDALHAEWDIMANITSDRRFAWNAAVFRPRKWSIYLLKSADACESERDETRRNDRMQQRTLRKDREYSHGEHNEDDDDDDNGDDELYNRMNTALAASGDGADVDCLSTIYRRLRSKIALIALSNTAFATEREFFDAHRPQRSGIVTAIVTPSQQEQLNDSRTDSDDDGDEFADERDALTVRRGLAMWWRWGLASTQSATELHCTTPTPSITPLQMHVASEHNMSAASGAAPSDQESAELPFTLNVFIIATESSLLRLTLTSLAAADVTETVNVHIVVPISRVDHADEFDRIGIVVAEFVWRYGATTTTLIRANRTVTEDSGVNVADVLQLLSLWQPQSDMEFAMLMSSGDVVSPYFDSWIVQLVGRYYIRDFDAARMGFDFDHPKVFATRTRSRRTMSTPMDAVVHQSSQALFARPPPLADTGSRNNHSLPFYQYQMTQANANIYFPRVWREFSVWLSKYSASAGASPCIPLLIANSEVSKAATVTSLLSLWLNKFAYAGGSYWMFADADVSIVVSSRAAADEYRRLTSASRASAAQHTHMFALSSVKSFAWESPASSASSSALVSRWPTVTEIPLFDYHFNRVRSPRDLPLRARMNAFLPECTD